MRSAVFPEKILTDRQSIKLRNTLHLLVKEFSRYYKYRVINESTVQGPKDNDMFLEKDGRISSGTLSSYKNNSLSLYKRHYVLVQRFVCDMV